MTSNKPRKRIFTCGVAALIVSLLLPLGAMWLFWKMFSAEMRIHSNLKELGMGLRMYKHEQGAFPPLSPQPGFLIFEMEALRSDSLSIHTLFNYFDAQKYNIIEEQYNIPFCHAHSSFYYLGYHVWDDASVEAFATAYRKRLQDDGDFSTNLSVDLPEKKLVLLDELSESMSQESILAFERPYPYPGPNGLYLTGPIPLSKPEMGGTVLYLDGRTEFVPYPGKWPMTERTMAILAELENLRESSNTQ